MREEGLWAEHGAPTVQRILLGTQLRRLREAAGITREAAGEEIRASAAKISRLELGRVGFKNRDIEDLLTLYGVTDEAERDGYRELTLRANARNWWQQHSDLLPGWFEMYLRLEQAATVIRAFEVQFVPGLLQTEAYARSVISLGHLRIPDEEVDRRVRLRMDRQKVLASGGAPQLWTVLDEAALSRPYGPPGVMREQLEHLLVAGRRPGVTVQMLPFRVGSHAAAGGPFSILRFAEPDLPDIVFLEQLNSAVYLDKRPDVEQYAGVWERLVVQALTPAATRTAIRGLIEQLEP